MITYTLLKPVTVGGETLNEIRLDEPTVDQLDRAQRNAETGMQVVIRLIVLIAGVSEAHVRAMGQRDWNAINRYLDGFTQGGPADGAVESRTSPISTDGAPATAST
jgi:hypothetical protein